MTSLREIYLLITKIESARELNALALIGVIPIYAIILATDLVRQFYGIIDSFMPVLSSYSLYVFTSRLVINDVQLSFIFAEFLILATLFFILSLPLTFVTRVALKDVFISTYFIKFPFLILLASVLFAYISVYLLGSKIDSM